MKTMILLSMVVIPLYLLALQIICKHIPSSLSAGYYEFKKSIGSGYPFRALLFSIIVLIAPSWFELGDSVNNNFTFLAFLSCISLGGVAIKANYLFGDRDYHYIFTAIAAALSILWAVVTGLWIAPFIIFAMGLTIIYASMLKQNGNIHHRWTKSKGLLILEISAFYSIFVNLLILSIK